MKNLLGYTLQLWVNPVWVTLCWLSANKIIQCVAAYDVLQNTHSHCFLCKSWTPVALSYFPTHLLSRKSAFMSRLFLGLAHSSIYIVHHGYCGHILSMQLLFCFHALYIMLLALHWSTENETVTEWLSSHFWKVLCSWKKEGMQTIYGIAYLHCERFVFNWTWSQNEEVFKTDEKNEGRGHPERQKREMVDRWKTRAPVLSAYDKNRSSGVRNYNYCLSIAKEEIVWCYYRASPQREEVLLNGWFTVVYHIHLSVIIVLLFVNNLTRMRKISMPLSYYNGNHSLFWTLTKSFICLNTIKP